MKPGVAFPDFIRTEKTPKHKYADDSQPWRSSMRGVFLPLFLCMLLGFLLLRLFILQIAQGEYYRGLSDSNRIMTKAIHPPRGIIFDRNDKPLVFNIPGFRAKEGNKTIFLSKEKALDLISHGRKDVEIDSLRSYPYKEELSHVIGYIGQISQDELKTPFFSGYMGDSIVGKMGIEKQYEEQLRGVPGKKLSEVDSSGREIRILGQTDPVAGKNIKITIDEHLQSAAWSSLREIKKGAIVVSNPRGEILAMVSNPTFDPNLFTLDETYKTSSSGYTTVSDILQDNSNQPLLNRAISGTYPPGSTFKLITALSGLTNNVIDDTFTVEDTGILKLGDFSFGNWYFLQYGKTEGEVNIVKAIKRSNDIFFYKLAEKVGVEKLSKTASVFGVGRTLGIDLGEEARGLLPTETWKKKEIGESWYLGDTYHYGIGQGYLLTTPLQVNTWTQGVVNKGTIYIPHLLLDTTPKVLSSVPLSDKTVELIKEGMIQSCSTGGVAWPLFDFNVKNPKLVIDGKNILQLTSKTESGEEVTVPDRKRVIVACKTGTAQHGGEHTSPHAWITLFAPAYNPQIIVTVLAESSGEGSNVAAPIAKKILEQWFTQ